MDKTALLDNFENNHERYMEEWKEVLRFSSVSADPSSDEACRECAAWLVKHIAGMGFESRLIETPTKPMVFAERRGAKDGPVVLFYGHYDVQPVDPVDDWTTPPFEPEVRNGRMYARGAQDNKGQFMAALKAMESLASNHVLHPTVKILLEGEEECGSVAITAAAAGLRDAICSDILMVCDTGMASSGSPAIVMGLRGLIHLTVALEGANQDLHSGSHGGMAPNPAAGLSDLISSLHNRDGSVAVDGFYDGVAMPSERERALALASAPDDDEYERETGVPPVAGEKAFTPAERAGFRPTLEVNGLRSGYDGAGIKTIIPSKAIAKLSARLVPGQDSGKCLDAIVAHLVGNTPEGLRLKIEETGIGGPAIRLDIDSRLASKAKSVLEKVCGSEPVFQWCGASIPVTSLLAETSGGEPLLVGFGTEEDRIHAVDESFSVDQFRNCYMYVGMLLQSLRDEEATDV